MDLCSEIFKSNVQFVFMLSTINLVPREVCKHLVVLLVKWINLKNDYVWIDRRIFMQKN